MNFGEMTRMMEHRFLSRVGVYSRRLRMMTLALIGTATLVMFMSINSTVGGGGGVAFPAYIIFFSLLYVTTIFVEYASLWCTRDKMFHCARFGVHALVVAVLSYEMSVFYMNSANLTNGPPAASIAQHVTKMLPTPAAFHEPRS